MINQQYISDITSSLNPDYAAFVESDFSSELATQISHHNAFTPEQTESLKDVILLYLLLVFDSSQLAGYLREKLALTEEKAEEIKNVILSSLPDNFDLIQKQARGTLLKDQTDTQTPEPSTASPNQTNPTPADTKIRTMSQDMRRAKGGLTEEVYRSTQEDILRGGKSG